MKLTYKYNVGYWYPKITDDGLEIKTLITDQREQEICELKGIDMIEEEEIEETEDEKAHRIFLKEIVPFIREKYKDNYEEPLVFSGWHRIEFKNGEHTYTLRLYDHLGQYWLVLEELDILLMVTKDKDDFITELDKYSDMSHLFNMVINEERTHIIRVLKYFIDYLKIHDTTEARQELMSKLLCEDDITMLKELIK